MMSTRASTIVAWFLVASSSFLFLLLKSYSLHATMTDDWIYAYLAKQVAHGAWPYRDFFFAHPPLHLAGLVPPLSLFGFDVFGVRAAASGASLLTGLLLWRIARRALPARGWIPEIGAALAPAAFLLAFDVLRSSSHVTGGNGSLLLVTAGGWALGRGWRWRAGILLGMAPLIGLYVLPISLGLLAIAGWFAWKESGQRALRSLRPLIFGFAIAFIGIQLVYAIPAPRAYWDGVYRYHSMKRENVARSERTWKIAAAYHPYHTVALPLALGALLGASGLRRRHGIAKPRGKSKDRGHSGRKVNALETPAGEGAIAATERRAATSSIHDSVHDAVLGSSVLLIGYALFLTTLRELYAYYLLPLYAITSLLLALAVAGWFDILGREPLFRRFRKRNGSAPGGSGRGPGTPAAIFLVTIVVCLGIVLLKPNESDLVDEDATASYVWTPSPLPSAVDEVVKSLFWRSERKGTDRSGTFTRYLWHESLYLGDLSPLLDVLRKDAKPGDELVGDSHLAPLVALRSGLSIAGHEADTNTKRFTSRMTPMSEFLARLDREPPRWVVVTDDRYIHGIPAFQEWTAQHYRTVAVDESYRGYVLVLGERK